MMERACTAQRSRRRHRCPESSPSSEPSPSSGPSADGPLGVTEVADRVRLPKSTVARLLASLAAEGAVEQVPDGTDYRIGGRLVTLAAGVRPDPQPGRARPTTPRGARRIDRRGGRPVDPGRLPRPLRRPGRQSPPRRCPGLDRHAPADARGLVGPGHPRPHASAPTSSTSWPGRSSASRPTTVVDPALIRERLRRARIDGFAWTRDEVAEGISSVAAALADEDGEVIGAIHVHGPSYRFPESAAADRVAAEIVASAARISASLRQAG